MATPDLSSQMAQFLVDGKALLEAAAVAAAAIQSAPAQSRAREHRPWHAGSTGVPCAEHDECEQLPTIGRR